MAHLSSRMRVNARELRRTQTPAEYKVWWWLRDRTLGCKFRRQVPMGAYVLDFYCAELRLAIELDGPQHEDVAINEYDSARTVFLHERGIEVVRMPNELIDGDGENGISCIKRAIARRAAE
jgi:very-short-patch-repair endonuclease